VIFFKSLLYSLRQKNNVYDLLPETEVELLVVDDFAIEKATDWSEEMFTKILDDRMNYKDQRLVIGLEELKAVSKKLIFPALLLDESVRSYLAQQEKVLIIVSLAQMISAFYLYNNRLEVIFQLSFKKSIFTKFLLMLLIQSNKKEVIFSNHFFTLSYKRISFMIYYRPIVWKIQFLHHRVFNFYNHRIFIHLYDLTFH
jgi:hypothetical protein